MTREILPTTVPDGDNSSPNVLIRTGGTKSKFKYNSNTKRHRKRKLKAKLHVYISNG